MTQFQIVTVLGRKALLSYTRIKEKDKPKESYLYQVRHTDDKFEPAEIAKLIMVNHYGSLLFKEELPISEKGYLLIDHRDPDQWFGHNRFVSTENFFLGDDFRG